MLKNNLKQSFLIKKFFIHKEIRQQKRFDRNLNWGNRIRLPKVE